MQQIEAPGGGQMKVENEEENESHLGCLLERLSRLQGQSLIGCL